MVLVCSICGRSVDVEHFEVYLRVNRKQKPIRAGAGSLEMCSVCWTKYAMGGTLTLHNWDGLMQRKAAILKRRGAEDLPIPLKRRFGRGVVSEPKA
jgi:hypothetical protein